jgi:hypothetical protein
MPVGLTGLFGENHVLGVAGRDDEKPTHPGRRQSSSRLRGCDGSR